MFYLFASSGGCFSFFAGSPQAAGAPSIADVHILFFKMATPLSVVLAVFACYRFFVLNGSAVLAMASSYVWFYFIWE
jgi:hypothetical protein